MSTHTKASHHPSAPIAVKSSATPKAITRVEKRQTTSDDAQSNQYLAAFRMEASEKIEIIRQGVPAMRVNELSGLMRMPKEALIVSLGLSRATISRKVKEQQRLNPQESERVMGMQTLIGQVQAMIDTESAADFDAAEWLSQWLSTPLPALGNATALSLMDTVEGQKYVSNLLKMAQSGAYA